MPNDLISLIARLDEPESSLTGEMRGQDGVRLLPSHWRVPWCSHNQSVSHNCDEPVDVSAQVNLDQVPVGQGDVGLSGERGEVADTVVDGNAGGEGDPLHQLLVLLERLWGLLNQPWVTMHAPGWGSQV